MKLVKLDAKRPPNSRHNCSVAASPADSSPPATLQLSKASSMSELSVTDAVDTFERADEDWSLE